MKTMTSMLAILVTATALAAPPPPEAYGRLPALGDVALSPDGKHVVVMVGSEYRPSEPDRELSALRIIDLDTGKIEQTLAPPDKHTLRGVGWADDQRAYYTISASANQKDLYPSSWPMMFRGSKLVFFRTGVFSLQTKAATILMDSAAYRTNVGLAGLQSPIEGEPGSGRMMAWGGATGFNATPRLGVYRVNLDTGNGTPLEVGNAETRGYMLDERGEIVARVDIDERANRWQLLVNEGGKYRKILEDVSEMGQPLGIFGLLPDGRIAAMDPHEEGERSELLAIDPKTGEKTVLHKTEGSDVGALVDPWTRRVIGVRWADDLPQQQFFDEQLKTLHESMKPYFADGYAVIYSWSRDRSRLLVFGERAGDAGAFYVYEPANKKLRSLGKAYPALGAPETLGTRQSIKYKARDGKSVPAYLTLPAGVEPKNLPLVLLVHGGPHARDTFMFDWWSSFLASRGYAVLQANFRGSTGYGYEWFDAGRGGWGDGVMQHDVEDGADALVKMGMVDASRVCIMGGSYGGYAALAGATLTPQRYACSVSVNGVSDPQRMLNDAESSPLGKRAMSAEWWRKSMGDDIKHLHDISPINFAERVKAPVLILHGINDSVVPVEQSRRMNAKLKGADKNVRYVELQGDDHWLSSASTRTQMLIEIEKFLAENLKPAAKVASN
jgi:dipeptidyl aminopeptidase/acylaminoacyl peptidase